MTVPWCVVKPDQHAVEPVLLAHELPHVPLTAPAHLRCPRVAQVRVVRPDDNLRTPGQAAEVGGERVKRLGHVAVSQVPR